MNQVQSVDTAADGAPPLDQAIREFVPEELRAELYKAEERCKGLSRRTTWLPHWHGERAIVVNRHSKDIKHNLASERC